MLEKIYKSIIVNYERAIEITKYKEGMTIAEFEDILMERERILRKTNVLIEEASNLRQGMSKDDLDKVLFYQEKIRNINNTLTTASKNFEAMMKETMKAYREDLIRKTLSFEAASSYMLNRK